jgi:hypothetical protein
MVKATPSTSNNYQILFLVLMLVTLVTFLLLGAPNVYKAQLQRASHIIPSKTAHNGTHKRQTYSTPTSALQTAPIQRSSLDNDADNDGDNDGLVDPIISLVLASLWVPLVESRLLIILCEPAKLSSVWCPVLERPG